MSDWKFIDPPNTAVIVTKRIMNRQEWIGYVSHDADDGGWQFHSNASEPRREIDAAVVSLDNVLSIDATVSALADLPIGWHAHRDSKDGPWKRAKS